MIFSKWKHSETEPPGKCNQAAPASPHSGYAVPKALIEPDTQCFGIQKVIKQVQKSEIQSETPSMLHDSVSLALL